MIFVVLNVKVYKKTMTLRLNLAHPESDIVAQKRG